MEGWKSRDSEVDRTEEVSAYSVNLIICFIIYHEQFISLIRGKKND